MAHEYLQACQALGPRLRDSQTFAFETWAREYRGDLGIALSDVYGMSAFLRDFDLYFCKLFDGARHDSGDPFEWGERLIAHYDNNRVDPRTKTLIFSDALTFPLAIRLYRRFYERTRLAFGVGTNLTNDLGYVPLQIVIKMVRCNGQPVANPLAGAVFSGITISARSPPAWALAFLLPFAMVFGPAMAAGESASSMRCWPSTSRSSFC
jgi:nicotinate phosphoribosyltransferase